MDVTQCRAVNDRWLSMKPTLSEDMLGVGFAERGLRQTDSRRRGEDDMPSEHGCN